MSVEDQGAVTGPAREPWLAANLSMLFPGLGQWEAGHKRAALLLGSATVILFLLAAGFLFAPRLPGWVGGLLVPLALAADLMTIVDAHRRVARNNPAVHEETRTASPDAWKTLFLNRLLPGIGHAYEGRWLAAILWLVAFLAALMMPPPVDALLVGLVMAAALWHGWARTRARRSDAALLPLLIAVASVWAAAEIAVPAWLKERVVRAFRIPSLLASRTLPLLSVAGPATLPEVRALVVVRHARGP